MLAPATTLPRASAEFLADPGITAAVEMQLLTRKGVASRLLEVVRCSRRLVPFQF
jgi:hypothetical protein